MTTAGQAKTQGVPVQPSLFDARPQEMLPKIGGRTFDPGLDGERLNEQCRKVWRFVRDGEWHTLREISEATRAPEASVSARLRDYRKKPFLWTVERRRRPGVDPKAGVWEYRLLMGE